jgi:hypothetical protein
MISQKANGLVGVPLAAAFVPLLFVALAGGCSSSGGAARQATAKPTGSSPYSIKVLQGQPGESTKEIDFVPQEVALQARGAAPTIDWRGGSAHRTPPAGSALKKQALVSADDLRLEDNGTPTTFTAGPIIVGDPSSLVNAAATECGMVRESTIPGTIATTASLNTDPLLTDIANQENNGNLITGSLFIPAWTAGAETRAYYIFNNDGSQSPLGWPLTCDQVLQEEETLVCIADKLAQVADTVGPITYETAAFKLTASGPILVTQPWVIPPQSEANKFIVRDLAINVLAHVPMIDAFRGSNFNGLFQTCAEGYADYATTPDPGLATILFGASNPGPDRTPPLYPPFPTNGRSLVQERQAFEAGLLRAAGQLLHDLVRESVYADLAGAAARAAGTADPLSGQVLASDIDGKARYDSLGDIARVLLGRWEMDRFEPDPKCAFDSVTQTSVGEFDLLPKRADPGMIARTRDLGALTSNQAAAEALFEQSGIVLPDGSTTPLAPTLTARLIAIDAVRAGRDPTQAITNLVARLSPSDLQRGAQHNRTTFSLLTGASTASTTSIQAGANSANLSVQPVPGSDGIAVVGGLLRSAVQTDPVARSGPMMVASQCPETGGSLNEGLALMEGSDLIPGVGTIPPYGFGANAIAMNPAFGGVPPRWESVDSTGQATMGPTYDRQDVFSVGQAIRNRLVKLREYADRVATNQTSTTSSSGPDAVARAAAVAELGAWAGTGRMVLSTDAQENQVPLTAPPSNVFLDFVGVDPSDFGVATVTDLTQVVSLVAGSGLFAECAAHLRTTGCDLVGVANATWLPLGATSDALGFGGVVAGDLHRVLGMTGSQVRLTFPLATAPPALDPTVPLVGLNSTFYVVLSQDPAKPLGTGEVLGALQLPASFFLGEAGEVAYYGEAGLALSPMRRELLYDAFGLGKWVGAAPPHAGELPIAGTPSFCVERVPRDIFVPLQNDLTDNSSSYENSWQHYLNLASAAATNADNLGQQLVDVGFQKDQTVENAAEQILTETGNPVNAGDLSVDPEGKINAGPSNGALASVLNSPTFDAVFFGCGPASNSASDVSAALGCSQNNTQLCTKSQTAKIVSIPLDQLASPPAASDALTFTYVVLNLNHQDCSSSQSTGPTSLTCQQAVAGALQMKGVGSGNFNAESFVSGLSKIDLVSLQAGIFQTQMLVQDDTVAGVPTTGHWKVTFDGIPLMDSDASDLWPGCLAGTCAFTKPSIAAFNDMFRYCPDPATGPRTSPLGGCDGGDPAAELNGLRWRVQGALWLAAAITGGIPGKMFTSPIPAINLAVPTDQAPVSTFFGNGSFNLSGGTVNFSSDPNFPVGPNELADLNTINVPPTATDPNSRYFHWGPNGSQFVPIWLLALYSPSALQSRNETVPFTSGDAPQTSGGPPFVHVFATNLTGASDYGDSSNLADFFAKAARVSGLSTTQLDPTIWPAVAQMMKGQQCPDPTSNGSFALPGTVKDPAWLQGLVATLKTQQDPKSEMRAQYYHGEDQGKFSGIWGTAYRWNGSAFEEHAPNGIPNVPPGLPWLDQVGLRWHNWYSDGFPCFSGCDHYSVTDYWNGATVNVVVRGVVAGVRPADNSGLWANQRNPSDPAGNPDARMRYALNSGAPRSNCDAAWQLTQAMATACLLAVDADQITPPTLQSPPQINSVNDLVALSAYLKTQLHISGQALRNAYVAHVPVAVVANAMNVPGTLSSSAGNVGKDLAQASNALLQIYADWQNVQKNAETISNAIDGTRNAIQQADTQEDKDQIQNEIEKLQTLKSMADDVAEIAGGMFPAVASFGTDAPKATAGAAKLAADIAIFSEVDKLNGDIMATHQEAINAAITNLNEETNTAGTAMDQAYTAVHQDINNLSAGAAALTTDRASASYYAGKAAGAEVWNCTGANGDPIECESHVNTVLNRRYDGTQIRYNEALKNAKALAYLARLSIEQRLGVRLNDIQTPVGPLDPPSTWADGVCHLTGVNYKKLRSQINVADAGTTDQITAADQAVASEFADSFIGDYVQKLTDFVAFYNVVYPEQDGNDTAVLSLRESLLGGPPLCQQPSPNLLADSSRLYILRDLASQSSTPSVSGWTKNTCAVSDVNCLRSAQLQGMQLPAVPGGATWLVDQPPPTASLALPDGGVPFVGDAGFANLGALPGPADDVESQAVVLSTAGTYLLSWWDQAIDPTTGAPPATPPATPLPAYRVGVYDVGFVPVAGFTGAPTATGDVTGRGWSPRHALKFTVATPGIFYVAFGASADNTMPGSVVISDVQLELAPSSGTPSPYVDTNSAAQMTSFDCALTPSQLRGAFQRNCDADGTCHWDLTTPVVINTQSMTSDGLSIAGKLAKGNFNFRHIDVALNVVGTGVIDCTSTGSPDCFGSGFLQYALDDDATSVGVLGFDNQYRPFDFGTATIDHAKAVTAERYITTPVGSADQQLINQFLAVQFRGRPIDGTYHLKIFDTPALHFDRIEDIQVVLNYHYWSRVITASNSN